MTTSKRVVLIGLIVGVVIVASLALPLNTKTSIIGTEINLDILLWLISPFLFFGFMLEAVSTWSNRFHGGAGRFVGGIAKSLAPAFLYMVPLEVAFILLFVAISLQVPFVWNNFPTFFAAGLYGLLLIFTWRYFWTWITSTYELAHRFYDLMFTLRYKKNVIRPQDPNRTLWLPLLADAFSVVWVYVILPIVGTELIGDRSLWTNPTVPSIAVLIIGLVGLVLITLLVLTLKWKHPNPKAPA